MNDFENDDLYELTAEESRQNARSMVRWLLYLVLAASASVPPQEAPAPTD